MRRLISIPLLLSLCACADIGYYWANARGHLAVMNQRADIEELLADPATPSELRARLRLVQEIRQFSVARLALPENGSYRSYVELGRPYLIQNLFAAPEFSTQLRRWCYPIIGCASYRGYYDETELLAYADELEASGFEVYIGKVSAYSTLGWFDDPVLSSFIDWPDYRLAGLLFHELTHQRIYIDDDTAFNESLASAVQRVGTELWLEAHGPQDELEKLARWTRYHTEVIEMIESTRALLAHLYSSSEGDADKRREKARIFADARRDHQQLASKHGVTGGFGAWFAGELNNAKIGSVAAYNSQTPAFINMLRALELNFAVFYDYVDAVGELDKSARDDCLQAWRLQARRNESCPAMPRPAATAS